MKNIKNTELDEESLKGIAGGKPGVPGAEQSTDYKKCFFVPTGKTKTDPDGSLWAECGSFCRGGFGCSCYGERHCVGKWHRLNSGTQELSPADFSNHKEKLKSNNYNT